MMDAMPRPWSAAIEAQKQFFEEVATASSSVLISDYDGTLAPFHEDKMQAFPYEGLEERLVDMVSCPNIKLVLVSGRSARELRRLLPFADQVEIWGSHGREHLAIDGSYNFFPLTTEQEQILGRIDLDLMQSGFERWIERKPASIAVHWRGASNAERQLLETFARELGEKYATASDMDTLPFDNGLEIRARGRTKADAVADILEQEAKGVVAAYLGDDRTDEDAFPALKGRGISVLVRPKNRQSLADYWMIPPSELLLFFDRWLETARSRV